MQFNKVIFGILFIFLGSCSEKVSTTIEPKILPQPSSLELKQDNFILNNKLKIFSTPDFQPVSKYFIDFLKEQYSFDLISTDSKDNCDICFLIQESLENEESYTLEVTKENVVINAATPQGSFYATQTLKQLLPLEITEGESYAIQGLTITDTPQFGYRGMHLDVGRHFYSVDFIKKYIDLIALMKMNTFHWHLTEDQGWRIEIKKYPRLTSHAAFRNETLIGHYSDQPHQFDGKRYGGFYTQEQIKELVAYASERFVTIIPEIEMPGHSQAAISAYPELGCTGEAVEVASKWGVFEEVYCPHEKTFAFLEDVIDEVVELFPGKYIHIGGDEAPKTRWKNCNSCQQLIKEQGLKDEHELQSYFISRMEKYINSKGKQIIGWDEILEGGLAPNATVMSWRGMDGAIQAAKEHHEVIMTPTSHCYFDYYQSDNPDEPLAIGGFLPLEKVYHFNPLPKELSEEEQQYVLGAQGNVWTEYMPTSTQVEYMAFPRAIALSEALWSSEGQKNYDEFLSKLEFFYKRLDKLNVNYANHLYDISGTLDDQYEQLYYSLYNEINDKEIRYTLDGSQPSQESDLYLKPFAVDKDLNIKAATFFEGEQLGGVFEEDLHYHKAVGKTINVNVDPHPAYNAGGLQAMINSINGSNLRFGDKEWLGFWGENLEIQIDLGALTEISEISTRFFNANGQWIYAPKTIQVFTSENDTDYTEAGTVILTDEQLIRNAVLKMKAKVRYIKITIPKYGIIPDGLQGAGNEAWTFIDEIQIR